MLCTGKLRHCFFGTYTAIIGLRFNSLDDARSALSTLGEGWELRESTNVLVWSGDGEALEAVKARFQGWRLAIDPCGWKHCKRQCRTEPIDSIAHSIDVGPSFTLDVPPGVAVSQIRMFA